MIRHINAPSVNAALCEGLYHLHYHGLTQPSRNGSVVVSKMPVITTYVNPMNRVLVSATRDANPFFHLFESMWMLDGRNDVAFPALFAGNIKNYSDNGVTLHGAYGHRWRGYFGYDQLTAIIEELKQDPSTRRCVLAMWDGGDGGGLMASRIGDLQTALDSGKDVPCNTQAYFDTIDGRLNMTVTCRSNDVIWGAHGANVVHFSFLLEYMAVMTGIPMGVYRQFSNNYHVYDNLLARGQFTNYAEAVRLADIYSRPAGLDRAFDMKIRQVPLMRAASEAELFHGDLRLFMAIVDAYLAEDYIQVFREFETPFFNTVIGPMWRVWSLWKGKAFEDARHASLQIAADDWRAAAQSWLTVRETNREKVSA